MTNSSAVFIDPNTKKIFIIDDLKLADQIKSREFVDFFRAYKYGLSGSIINRLIEVTDKTEQEMFKVLYGQD